MIKRVIGFLVAVASLTVMAFVVMHRAQFRSIFPMEREVVPETGVVGEPAQPLESADSLVVPLCDSLQTLAEE